MHRLGISVGYYQLACQYFFFPLNSVITTSDASCQNFCSREDTIFCGVFDGHGPFGHMVAKKVRDSLPLKLCTHWKTIVSNQNNLHENGSVLGSMNSEEIASVSLDDEWCESLDADESEKLPEIYLILKQSLLKAFKLMDKELKLHPTIDCFCSGTTAVTLIKQVTIHIMFASGSYSPLSIVLHHPFFLANICIYIENETCISSGTGYCNWKCWRLEGSVGHKRCGQCTRCHTIDGGLETKSSEYVSFYADSSGFLEN